MTKNRPSPPAGIILSVLSSLVVVGMLTFAGPCGVHDDGTSGTCVWAARAALGAGVVALILSLVRVFELDEGERRGPDLGVGLVGALIACLPGTLIDLCASQAMRCCAIMRPYCMVLGTLMALVGFGDLVMRLLRLRNRPSASA